MNDFFYKKRIAVPVFIIMVLFSVFVLGGIGLREKEKEVLDVFYGKNELGIDVSLEYENIIGSCKNLLVVANKYLEKDHTAEGLIKDIEKYEKGDKFEKVLKDTGFGGMQGASKSIIERLMYMEIADKDRQYLIKIEADIDATFRKIKLSGYDTLAYEFNVLVANPENPYTELIAKANGIKGLPLALTNVTR